MLATGSKTLPSVPLSSIAIIGDGLRAALPAAYLAARCAAAKTMITVIPSLKAKQDDGEIITRPNIRHLHQLLRIREEDLLRLTQPRPVYATATKSVSGEVVLPFGPYGTAFKNTDFIHHYNRLQNVKSLSSALKPVSAYNTHLALHEFGDLAPFISTLEFGYRFSRHIYGQFLAHHAKQLGVKFLAAPHKELIRQKGSGQVTSIVTPQGMLDVDCIIDVREIPKIQQTCWQGNILNISTKADLPSIEIYQLQAAMARLSAFMPDKNFNIGELTEYNRLSEREDDLINDMRIFLKKGIRGAKGRPALARKIDVFCQRGRIPREDYEVFSSPEWLAAFLSAGLKPRYYDRLADAVPVNEAQSHIARVEADVAAVLTCIRN